MSTVGGTCIFLYNLLKTDNADIGWYLEELWGLGFSKNEFHSCSFKFLLENTLLK